MRLYSMLKKLYCLGKDWPLIGRIFAAIKPVFNAAFNIGNECAKSSQITVNEYAESSQIAYPPIPQNNPRRKGRCVAEGDWRGVGIEFGHLRNIVLSDPLYKEALALAENRTILHPDRRINIFLIMKFFLKKHCPGDIIEFGAYKGGNAIFMAAVAKKLYPGTKVYALDTFEGMPQTDKNIDRHNKGDFADVSFIDLQDYIRGIGLDNLVLVKGLFEDTVVDVMKKVDNVILAHIDCDIYSAVSFSYTSVKPVMANGGYIVFDDATVSSCLGATEAVEDLVYGRDHLHAEQISPHFVFRAFSD